MACAIMLQLLLEGRGDFYVPETPIDQRGKPKQRDIIDPLFEKEDDTEFSI
jgi:hypothetical protein